MRSIQFVCIMATLSLATACSRNDADANAAGNASVPAAEQAVPADHAQPQRATARSDQAIGPGGELIDGPLARDPGFRIPAPGSSTPRSPGNLAEVQLDPDTVRLALMEGMPGSGESIQVRSDPRGMVELSGEVATVAERQRAHYLARALPGVAEVDIRDLRVRQR